MNPNTAAPLTLHHYPNSPFAEKIRLIMGFKGLAWHSVYQPVIMPKPDLTALTGGYRRIPVLQVGCDIVCDTALICDVLEHLCPTPTLYPAQAKGVARVIAQWADDKLFTAGMAYNFSPAGAAHFFKDTPPQAAKIFAEDRASMRGGAARTRPGDATAAYKGYLRRLANMLDASPFLLGEQPCIADFSAYHTLWFTRTLVAPLAGIFDATPTVLPWMDRMAALGHGELTKSSAAASLSIDPATWAQELFASPGATQTFVDDHGIALGTDVCVQAESFGLEPTCGRLIAATRTRISLERDDPLAGRVRVHFPKLGFVVKPL